MIGCSGTVTSSPLSMSTGLAQQVGCSHHAYSMPNLHATLERTLHLACSAPDAGGTSSCRRTRRTTDLMTGSALLSPRNSTYFISYLGMYRHTYSTYISTLVTNIPHNSYLLS